MRPRMHPSRDESAGEPAARHRPVNRLFPASAGDAEPRLQPRLVRRRVPWFAVLTMLLVPARSARTQAIGQGFELERVGQYGQAASIYFATLLADLAQRAGDWESAAREWAAALAEAPAQLPNAASELAEAPEAARERIARLLTAGAPSSLTRRLAGELLLGWGQSERAWAAFQPSVATPSPDAARALRRFADLAGARAAPDARRVRALALARWADMMPDPLAARARAEAARAFIEAGDRAGARDVLERVAGDTAAPPDAQALAQTAIIEALIAGGQLDDAAKRLETEGRLAAEDRAALRLKLARARITNGELD